MLPKLISRRHLIVLCVLFLCLASAVEAGSRKHRSRSRSRGPHINSLDPQARVRLQSALKEMNRRGLRPHVTSAYRSRAEQRSIYACAQKRYCRVRRGIYGARRPGTSLHESGLAVDLAGVARGNRRHRRLTAQGRQMVRVMNKHGFKWRYGLKDPAHFELHPRYAAKRNAGKRQYVKYSPPGASRVARSSRRRA